MRRSKAPSKAKAVKFQPPRQRLPSQTPLHLSNPTPSAKRPNPPPVASTAESVPKAAKPLTSINKPAFRKAGGFKRPAAKAAPKTDEVSTEEKPWRYHSCVYCVDSNKKHKKWLGDAVLCVRGKTAILKDMDGKDIAKSITMRPGDLAVLRDGETLTFCRKMVEIMGDIAPEHYNSGKCFTGGSSSASIPGGAPTAVNPKFKQFKKVTSGVTSTATVPKELKPRYDPAAPSAVVFHPPKGTRKPCIPVVVDPHLTHFLRSHQREGVQFMFECLTGKQGFDGSGCVLADDMGLGKTLQCISLIWTMLKQGFDGKALAQRALVVCPGSLVKNWKAEFKKWLGNERIKVFAVASDNKIEHFKQAHSYPVIIISYEMLLRSLDVLRKLKLDLLICDEAHRLKNPNSKTTKTLMSIPVARRVALTGTPVQNDLQEFFTLINFVNPGVLGSHATFKNIYEAPIMRSRQKDATPVEQALGEARSEELNKTIHLFVLRRTKDINERYLPPKTEMVLFCKPSDLQVRLYKQLLATRYFRHGLSSGHGGSKHLVMISLLKQLCNSPVLLASDTSPSAEDGADDMFQGVRDALPAGADDAKDTSLNGKLHVLRTLLEHVRAAPEKERVLVVSNSTKCLDRIQALCDHHGWPTLRLQGSTPTAKRLELVDRFNGRRRDDFVFLMSSKAGGVGLNIIGASRLVLYDTDWNPAHDLQAMARIWREGQTRPVFIYRLVATGTLEEKIYQRQVVKTSLGTQVVDEKDTAAEFSMKDLRAIFQLHESTASETLSLLSESEHGFQKLGGDTRAWQSFVAPFDIEGIKDDAIVDCLDNGVTCVFKTVSHGGAEPEPALGVCMDEGSDSSDEDGDLEAELQALNDDDDDFEV
eukprot:m.22119 g.22119  ORF g.22119 m.22119 type:complete len:872 (+) comp11205_c0_seq1:96-2711(+)